jgi:type II secretory pathway component GspD/PulD (secretin)
MVAATPPAAAAVTPAAATAAATAPVAGAAGAVSAGATNAAASDADDEAREALRKANLAAAIKETRATAATTVLTPTPMGATAPAGTTPPTSYASMTAGPTEQGLRVNMRNVTVDQALLFLTEKAGFTINRQTATSPPTVTGTVDVVSDDPLSKDEIVTLFNKVLAYHDLTAVQDGKTLTIETLEDARNAAGTPVRIDTNAEVIPADAQVVTEIIPVHTLNPKQVVTDLYGLIPPGALMNTSDAGTSVIMTASQADIRRFAQIIAALDSTGNGDLEVFLLTYADSKAIAQELKDVFTTDASAGGNNGGGGLAAIFGNRGGGRGGGGGGTEDSRRQGIHVNAVSDDENNAVLVSAPIDYMPSISNLITKLDIPQEDTIEIKLFTLRNADCTDVTAELLALFPDPNTGQNANARGGRGNTMAFQGGGRGGAGGGGATGMSDRQKKQVTVNAVADPRTQSVLVTASKDTMTQIEQIIDRMDSMDTGHVKLFTYTMQNGDVLDLAGPLSDLFQSATGRNSSSSSTQNNALLQRMNTGAANATTTANSSVSGSTGGGGGGGR